MAYQPPNGHSIGVNFSNIGGNYAPPLGHSILVNFWNAAVDPFAASAAALASASCVISIPSPALAGAAAAVSTGGCGISLQAVLGGMGLAQATTVAAVMIPQYLVISGDNAGQSKGQALISVTAYLVGNAVSKSSTTWNKWTQDW